jgi:hypothetical protein
MRNVCSALAICSALAVAPSAYGQTQYNCTTSGSSSLCYGSDGSSFSTTQQGNSAYTYGTDSTGQPFSCNTVNGYTSCQ